MQKAETVLSILKQKSKQDESHRYDRIYRNLFNEDFFLRAYQKIHAKQGNMTPGTDGTTIDGFSRKQISQLIELLKWERYQPKPVRRTYIPKKLLGDICPSDRFWLIAFPFEQFYQLRNLLPAKTVNGCPVCSGRHIALLSMDFLICPQKEVLIEKISVDTVIPV